jgi:hemerythrin-like domain-containing protein
MNALLLDLRSDHHHMARIMKLMRYAVNPMIEEQSLEHLELLGECIEYMTLFPDNVHHKTEDAIFEQLVKQDKAAIVYVETLQHEHIELAKKSKEIASLVHALQNEHIMSLDNLISLTIEYIELQTRHMRIEEATVFTLVDQKLDIADWKHIIKVAPPRQGTPGSRFTQKLESLQTKYAGIFS